MRRSWHLVDVARWEPLGPPIPVEDMDAPSVGLLHGCPALAATVGTSLRLWDVGTAPGTRGRRPA